MADAPDENRSALAPSLPARLSAEELGQAPNLLFENWRVAGPFRDSGFVHVFDTATDGTRAFVSQDHAGAAPAALDLASRIALLPELTRFILAAERRLSLPGDVPLAAEARKLIGALTMPSEACVEAAD